MDRSIMECSLQSPEQRLWTVFRMPPRSCANKMRLDPNATHKGQSVVRPLQWYRINMLLEAAQRGFSLKKCRKEFCEQFYAISCIEWRWGSHISRLEMESTTEKSYIFSSLFCSSTSVPSPNLPSGEEPRPSTLFQKVWAATKSIKNDTAPRTDHISAVILRAEAHSLHDIFAPRMASHLQEGRVSNHWELVYCPSSQGR